MQFELVQLDVRYQHASLTLAPTSPQKLEILMFSSLKDLNLYLILK